MCNWLVLCYIWNSGKDVNCSLIATLYHRRMLGKLYLIVLAIP